MCLGDLLGPDIKRNTSQLASHSFLARTSKTLQGSSIALRALGRVLCLGRLASPIGDPGRVCCHSTSQGPGRAGAPQSL